MNVFGKITVIDEKRDNKDKVLCKCECGKEKRISIFHLRSGSTKSCGCLKKEKMKEEASKRFTRRTPKNLVDYTGKVIGEIKVLKRISNRRPGTTTYLIKCGCGKERQAEISNLRRCKYLKCECGPFKHPLKNVLQRMIDRCENPEEISYKWYGKKGIKVCEEWKRYPIKFIEWSLSNGYKKGLTIDRIDSKKGYSPENCQWITLSENSRKAMKERWNA